MNIPESLHDQNAEASKRFFAYLAVLDSNPRDSPKAVKAWEYYLEVEEPFRQALAEEMKRLNINVESARATILTGRQRS